MQLNTPNIFIPDLVPVGPRLDQCAPAFSLRLLPLPHGEVAYVAYVAYATSSSDEVLLGIAKFSCSQNLMVIWKCMGLAFLFYFFCKLSKHHLKFA